MEYFGGKDRALMKQRRPNWRVVSCVTLEEIIVVADSQVQILIKKHEGGKESRCTRESRAPQMLTFPATSKPNL